MAPKRGDIKTQNGQRYRYGYKNGKLMWIKDQSGFNPKLGEKLKIAGRKIGKGYNKVKQKVFGTPKKKQNFSSKTGTKTPNEKLKTWRVDKDNNKKLQQERKSGKDETYSRKLTPEATKQVNNTKNDKKKKRKTPSGYVRYKSKLLSTRTAQGKNALNRLKATKRAQEAAKKRLANK